jgi:hypothetical protein
MQTESHTGHVGLKRIAPASEAETSTQVFDDGNVLDSKLRPFLNKVLAANQPGIATTTSSPCIQCELNAKWKWTQQPAAAANLAAARRGLHGVLPAICFATIADKYFLVFPM